MAPPFTNTPERLLDGHAPYRTITVQAMAAPETKTTRIELRAEERRARRIRYAAELTRQSLSSFVLAAAEERAEAVIAESSGTTVPSKFFDAMWVALDAPPRANEALARRARARRRVTQK